MIVIAATAIVLLGYAAVIFVTASAADREMRAVAGTMVVATVLISVPAIWALRRRITRPYARLDEEGIVWGSDRVRDPSIPWPAIAKIRIVPSPARLSDDRTFLLGPVAGWHGSPPSSWWARRRMRFLEIDTGTPYVLATNRTDCPWRELQDLLRQAIPRVRILEGSLRDPA